MSNLYVADGLNGTIRRIVLASGSVTTVVGQAGRLGIKLGPVPGLLTQPSAVFALPTGELIIADMEDNAILEAR